MSIGFWDFGVHAEKDLRLKAVNAARTLAEVLRRTKARMIAAEMGMSTAVNEFCAPRREHEMCGPRKARA